MQKHTIFLIILSTLLSAGCHKSHREPPLPANPELRIFNATPWSFDSCVVTILLLPPERFNYGRVNTNKKTDYRAFSLLYRYAYIRLGMNNKEYTIQPFDLGGTPLPPGRYTYKLTYLPSSDQLSLQLIQD